MMVAFTIWMLGVAIWMAIVISDASRQVSTWRLASRPVGGILVVAAGLSLLAIGSLGFAGAGSACSWRGAEWQR